MIATGLQSKARAIAIFGWVGLLAVTLVSMTLFERQRLFSELHTEAAILHRLASQRADQHDAHLTSLSALAVAGEAEPQDLLLNVAATIQRFYPRIAAVDLVPLDDAESYTSTRNSQPAELTEMIIAGAQASNGELVLRSMPQADSRYLVIKRSPNTDAARFGLSLTIDAEQLLASDNDFWKRRSVTRNLRLPDGTLLVGDGSDAAAISFSNALGSSSQPMIFEAGVSPRLLDLLPVSRVVTVVVGITLLYLLTILGLRQFMRARRAERQAQLSADEARLAHASRVNSLGEMASGMAHELTQPLTAILSQAQAGRHLARRGDISGSENGFIRIVEQAKRAAAILDRLRDWTRPHSERIEDVAVSEAIENVEALLRREMETRSVTLTSDLVQIRDVSIRLDRIALEQIVFNLTRNAVEAAEGTPGAWVRITSTATETGIMLDITDSGSGVPESIRGRVFEPFVTGKSDGTGLGLALCQRLAERMGGELSLVEDRPETVFRLWLPRPTAENPEVTQ